MGSLVDSGAKRVFPFASADSSSMPTATKKPRLHPSIPPAEPPPAAAAAAASTSVAAPPSASTCFVNHSTEPFRRPIHAPQRSSRAFGLGPAAARLAPRRAEAPRAAAVASRHDFTARAPAFPWQADSTPRAAADLLPNGSRSRSAAEFRNSTMPNGATSRSAAEFGNSTRGLGLKEYKNLVREIELSQPPPAKRPRFVVETPPTVQVEDRDDGMDWEQGVMLEPEQQPQMQLEAVVEFKDAVSVKTVPYYRTLYESTVKEFDEKLRKLEFEVKLEEAHKSFFDSLKEVIPLKKEEVIPEPFTPLTDEEEACVSQALHGGNRNELLVKHEPSNIMITRSTLQCLDDYQWLNDEVINLYFELLKEREKRDPEKFLKCHYFNTFFYKKLTSGTDGYDYKAVKRWTSHKKLGYTLAECDMIFVPIHKEVHWCMAIIDVRNKKLQYLDSLGGRDSKALRILARYFVDEVKDKSGKQADALSWNQEFVEDIPHQKNGWDCGMFMLKYADFYSRDLGLSFSQEHMQYFRMRTAKEILRLRAE